MNYVRYAFCPGWRVAAHTLAKILGHADLSLLIRYVHPAQADIDSRYESYARMNTPDPELERMRLQYEDGKDRLEA